MTGFDSTPMAYSSVAEDDAWERHCYEVGRAMHDGWKAQKIANGFAPHPYRRLGRSCGEPGCTLQRNLHHPDMIDWDALSWSRRAINTSGGEIPFRVGYRQGLASHAWSVALDRDAGEKPDASPA